MRRLLPYLGFLPLLLFAVAAFTPVTALADWDPHPLADVTDDILGVALSSALVGLVIGLAGPWRAHMYRLRPGRIYPLH